MLAMQYSFTLPGNYDMSVIARRVQEKGRAFDDFPQLVFKAFLAARKDDDAVSSGENLYAPFYLWRTVGGMQDFLCGDKFRALVDSFGWPAVRTWAPIAFDHAAVAGEARFATRELVNLDPHANLDIFRRRETELSKAAIHCGALYALSAFEPTTWTYVRFRLWREMPAGDDVASAQVYRVLHLSMPERP
jgi:hypothetical protein